MSRYFLNVCIRTFLRQGIPSFAIALMIGLSATALGSTETPRSPEVQTALTKIHDLYKRLPDGKTWKRDAPLFSYQELETSFFQKYAFVYVSAAYNERLDEYIVAVNHATLESELVFGPPDVFLLPNRRSLSVSSYILDTYFLHIDVLNRIIEEEDLRIDEKYLMDYVMDLFSVASVSLRGIVYFDGASLDVIPGDGLPPDDGHTKSWFYLKWRMMQESQGIEIIQESDGIFRMKVCVWTLYLGTLSEWDFSVDTGGRLIIHDIRDITNHIGFYKTDGPG